MYFKALMLSGCVALAGCQSAQVVEQVQVAQAEQVNSITGLQFAPMKLPSSAIFDVTPNSQVLNYQGINSPVVAIELPADRGEYSINITSIIGDTAFVPNAVIYDENGRELERYGKDSFEYAKPRLHLGNRLVTENDFYPPTTAKSVYLVIYLKAWTSSLLSIKSNRDAQLKIITTSGWCMANSTTPCRTCLFYFACKAIPMREKPFATLLLCYFME